MKYTEKDYEMARRILEELEKMDEKEVEEWVEKQDHAQLLNTVANAPKKAETESEMDEEAYQQKSRRMTLKWCVGVAIVVIIALVISQFFLQ